jgi:hypothetical protein
VVSADAGRGGPMRRHAGTFAGGAAAPSLFFSGAGFFGGSEGSSPKRSPCFALTASGFPEFATSPSGASRHPAASCSSRP